MLCWNFMKTKKNGSQTNILNNMKLNKLQETNIVKSLVNEHKTRINFSGISSFKSENITKEEYQDLISNDKIKDFVDSYVEFGIDNFGFTDSSSAYNSVNSSLSRKFNFDQAPELNATDGIKLTIRITQDSLPKLTSSMYVNLTSNECVVRIGGYVGNLLSSNNYYESKSNKFKIRDLNDNKILNELKKLYDPLKSKNSKEAELYRDFYKGWKNPD